MRFRVRVVACLTALVCMLSCLSVFPALAGDGSAAGGARASDVRYTKKVVSVLFDNSGSMTNSDKRNHYAKYALQMLMSLLGENDTLIITPMNVDGSVVTNTSYGVEVNLKAADRNAEISRIMSTTFLSKTPDGGTPDSSIGIAVDQLEARGLKDREHLGQSAEDLEHWLVVLTDGDFTGWAIDDLLDEHIADFPSLRTIFFGIGSVAPPTSALDTLTQKYMLTAYRAEKSEEIAQEMQKIANQLSGRYALDSHLFSVSGSKVTVDLSGTELAFKNISVIAQNSGAKLTGATYNGASIAISSPCVITIDSVTGMKNGYTGVINGDPYLQGGKLVLDFNATLDADSVTILAEPALSIQPYFERYNGSAWERTTMQYINANLSSGDKIRIGYEVYEQATNKPIDLSKIFGKTEELVTYAGNSYAIGQDIPLVVGNNEIGITVSVKDGAYKLITSMRCIIEDNPLFYRVEGEYDAEIDAKTLQATSVFTVFVNDKPLSKAELEKYTWTVTAVAPDGSEAKVDATVGQDGKVSTVLHASFEKAGKYLITFTVTSSLGMSRVAEHTYDYKAGNLDIKQNHPEKFAAGATSANLEYKLYAGDVRLDKDMLTGYTWDATVTAPDGTTAPLSTNVEADGRITATVTATPEGYGEYEITMTVTAPDGASTTATHKIAYYPGLVEIIGAQIGTLVNGSTTADFEHTVKINGKQLTADDLARYNWNLTVAAPGGADGDFDFNIGADGKIVSALNLLKSGFGRYQVTFSLTFSESYVEEHTFAIDFYPASIALNVADGNNLSITQHQMLDNNQAMKFELTADGTPFAFDNGLTTYKVIVDGVDVTSYATVDGSTLIYAPRTEHFGGEAPVGDKSVLVKVECAEVATLNASATAQFSVSQTVYEVVSVDMGNKTVNRFALKDLDAALYFRVLRDGTPLPAEDLQAALDSGALTVKDNSGVFGWQFWLPCGNEVFVDTVDGEPTVVFKVVKDWIAPFDTFMAMLIFNGDKAVTVTYNDVSGTDAITFTPSNAWSYIWRILVILLVIHIILYIIGFFNGKCKSLPKGVFAYVEPNLPGNEEEFELKKVNFTFWQRYSWHIARFIPHKRTLWYHQPAFTCGDAVLAYNKEGQLGITFKTDDYYRVNYDANGTAASDKFDDFRMDVVAYCKGGRRPVMQDGNLKGKEIQSMFHKDADSGNIPHTVTVSPAGYYGMFEKAKVVYLIFFVRS